MLITTSDMIIQSFSLYKKYWRQLWIFVLLLFFPALISSISGIVSTFVIAYLPNSSLITNLATLAIIVASGLFSIWTTIALSIKIKNLLADKTDDNWKTLFTSTSQLIWPVILVSILVGIVDFGPGLILIIPAIIYQSWLMVLIGITLFIFPGVLFLIWYFLSSYATILDGKIGWDALSQSKKLVQGRWWKMFINLAVILCTAIIFGYLLQSALSYPVYALVKNEVISTVGQSLISSLVGSIITPFIVSSMIILFLSAKNSQHNDNQPATNI